MRSNKLLTLLLILATFVGFCQKYPKDYFMFPIRPGQQNYLSGTMGELRGNHFHAGIDIKTGGVIGYKVHASADGYIARIKISPYGYGHTLYIQHPNGYTTVYAHLESFKPEVEKYARQQQYAAKNYRVDLYLKANQFPIKKGEIIGYSGNTGGSMGPHLHFEIRNRNQEAMNPLLFGFSEVSDNIPPRFKKLSIRPEGGMSRINGKFEEEILYPWLKKRGAYYIKDSVFVEGTFKIAVDLIDQLNGATNHNGVTQYELFVDDQRIFSYNNEEISFIEKYYNAHVDYGTWYNGNGRMHKCYLSDGNFHKYYSHEQRGFITLKDELPHVIKVVATDSYNNKSSLEFNARKKHLPFPDEKIRKFNYDIYDNTLICRVPMDTQRHITCRSDFRETKPFYSTATERGMTYLFDLRKNLPHALICDTTKYDLPLAQMIPSQKGFSFFHKRVNMYFPNGALFDTLYLELKTNGDTFAIGNSEVPLNRYTSVSLNCKNNYDLKSKYSVYKISGRYPEYFSSSWEENKVTFRTKEFGTYTILPDTVAPEITYLGRIKNTVRFKIRDRLSGIGTYNAYLNGEWVLFRYDYSDQMIWSISDDPLKSFTGDFELIVMDEVGNKSVFRQKF